MQFSHETVVKTSRCVLRDLRIDGWYGESEDYERQ